MNSLDIVRELKEFSNKLHELHIDKGTVLKIPLSNDNFKKLDEDLYYRQNPNGNEYIPSDDVIMLQIDNVEINFIRNE